MNVSELDLYDILGILQDATESEIKKAYRKKALKCHPDKNPDNPLAAAEWERLAKALEILSDPDAKAAYDKVLKARKAAELRNKALESKRRKIKEDLESREASFRREQESSVDIKISLEKEIERLREEGSVTLKREQELLKNELLHPEPEQEAETPKLKIKWKAGKEDSSNGGYSYACLKQIFEKYGQVTNLIVSSKRNGSAIVEFSSTQAAVMAVSNEFGLSDNPLQLTWLSGKPLRSTVQPAPSASFPRTATDDDDFENAVLRKLMQAEEARQKEEGNDQDNGDVEGEGAPNNQKSPNHFWSVRGDTKNENELDESMRNDDVQFLNEQSGRT